MRDTITIKVEIEAPYSTLQEIRQALADTQTIDLLRRQAQSLVKTRLTTMTNQSFELNTSLVVPQKHQARKGQRNPIPQVKDGGLTWYDPYEPRLNKVGKVGSQAWEEWMIEPTYKSFSFVSKRGTTFTAIKNKRGYWEAHKRLGGILKRKYLGKIPTLEKMEEVAFDLAQRSL